jgi:hypothetical protein
MSGHACVMCGRSNVPAYRFACPHCFKVMPLPMRHAAVAAWKFRMSDPVGYSETVAMVLMWHRDWLTSLMRGEE